MKKIVKRITKILLLVVMILSELMTPISILADEIRSQVPHKGDVGINNITSDNGGESTTVTAGNSNVNIKKTVIKAKDSLGNYINGRYKVEFDIIGKDIENPKPVYVVVVFDKSGSMNCVEYEYYYDGSFKCVNRGTKWNDAVRGTKDFATQLLKEIPTANIALVTFSDTSSISPARGFKNENLNNANFGEADGATNLHAGLKRAETLLDSVSEEDASKYIVVISDGEPTYYLKNNGTIGGNGASTNKEILDATYAEANKLKNNGIRIFSIGYSLPSGIVYDDRYDMFIPSSSKYGALTAKDILKSIASKDTEADIKNGITHYLDSDPTALVETLKKVAHKIVTVPAGTNATLVDNIGDNFIIINEDGTISTNNSYTNNTINEITEAGTKITFYVEIDPNAEDGWHNVNDGFLLNYTDENGISKQIVYGDNIDEKDPEVY